MSKKVCLVAPSGFVSFNELTGFQLEMAKNGFQVLEGQNLYQRFGRFAGTDLQRSQDLQWAINHPEAEIIFCARGGYGLTRILDGIDFSALKQYPKMVCGFSDVTALILALDNLGIQSVHGPVAKHFGLPEAQDSVSELLAQLGGKACNYKWQNTRNNKSGIGEGKLIGGNLTMVTNSLGTPSEINTQNAILFLEETSEALYHIDRMMVQLQRSGKLDLLKGLVFGQFTDAKDEEPQFGKTLEDLLAGYAYKGSFPVAFGFEAGHGFPNFPLPMGGQVTLMVDGTKCQLIAYGALNVL